MSEGPREPLLVVEGLEVRYSTPQGPVHAVRGVDLALGTGETLALVGESGCGKSTLARAIVGLVRPAAGRIRLGGHDLVGLSRSAWRPHRRHLQMLFQDPYASLDPRMTVASILAEPLRVHAVASGAELERRVLDLMDAVGLDASLRGRYPHEFSGGQRQRIGLARALALEPDVLLLDEPVSALDVSVQAQVLNLLAALKREQGLAYLLIAHDLGVVRHLADRIAVMFLGRIVETADGERLLTGPRHPYTRALLSAALVPDPRRARRRREPVLEGEVARLPTGAGGCAFRSRCPRARDRCAREGPRLDFPWAGHGVACHFPREEEAHDA
ncbi:MAG: ABC transporter ATP-binding protein [Planctomycetota bacterium]